MPPLREGLLTSSKDWDEVKPDEPEWTASNGWKDWNPIAYLPKHRRVLSRVRRTMARLPISLQASENLRPTAYLDGLRGFAAFLVYWHHHELWTHGTTGENSIFENGFGYEGKYHMVAFPVIRHFFTGGHYAVSTFFVISGYVLSLKHLSLIQAGEHVKLGDSLASAMFRRWPRLFIPLIVVMFIYAMSWHTFGMWINGANKQGNWWDEAWAFYYEFKNFSFVYKEGGTPWLSYNFHLWSIPVEFKGSMVIYGSQMALSRCSRAARLLCEVGLIFYFMYVADGWYCAMFIAGMLLCDLDLLAKKDELPRFLARLEPIKDIIYYHLLAISLYLGGIPSQNTDVNHLAKSRGWYYLSWLKPQAVFDYKWFYLWWAATFLVAAIPRIHWLRRFFETRFCQYLGRISFALYMVHGPVLWMLGDRLYLAAGWKTNDHMQHIPQWADKLHLPKAGPLGLEISFLVPQLILLPLTLGLAEVVTRFVDAPTVDFAAWLYRKTLGGKHVKA